jgi:hypothetical protein
VIETEVIEVSVEATAGAVTTEEITDVVTAVLHLLATQTAQITEIDAPIETGILYTSHPPALCSNTSCSGDNQA